MDNEKILEMLVTIQDKLIKIDTNIDKINTKLDRIEDIQTAHSKYLLMTMNKVDNIEKLHSKKLYDLADTTYSNTDKLIVLEEKDLDTIKFKLKELDKLKAKIETLEKKIS